MSSKSRFKTKDSPKELPSVSAQELHIVDNSHCQVFTFDNVRCPKCHNSKTEVIDSRVSKEAASVRRRRRCTDCQHRFTTVEEVLREGLVVIKRDGTREPFSSDKILTGIRRATEKRPVDHEEITLVVNEVIDFLEQEFDAQGIPSSAIGNLIMERLKTVDMIAYVRFACVYKEFKSIEDLKLDIAKLD